VKPEKADVSRNIVGEGMIFNAEARVSREKPREKSIRQAMGKTSISTGMVLAVPETSRKTTFTAYFPTFTAPERVVNHKRLLSAGLRINLLLFSPTNPLTFQPYNFITFQLQQFKTSPLFRASGLWERAGTLRSTFSRFITPHLQYNLHRFSSAAEPEFPKCFLSK